MKSCFHFCVTKPSSSASSRGYRVKVIGVDGELREYRAGVTAEEVVAAGECFICNSDDLYLDQPIPTLRAGDHLQGGHIYFALHPSKLQRPLSAPEMAALTLTAAAALHNTSTTKNSRISPSDDDFKHPLDYDCHVTVNSKRSRLLRSSSVTKLQRAASRRAKMAVRSFRLRLSTIYET